MAAVAEGPLVRAVRQLWPCRAFLQVKGSLCDGGPRALLEEAHLAHSRQRQADMTLDVGRELLLLVIAFREFVEVALSRVKLVPSHLATDLQAEAIRAKKPDVEVKQKASRPFPVFSLKDWIY